MQDPITSLDEPIKIVGLIDTKMKCNDCKQKKAKVLENVHQAVRSISAFRSRLKSIRTHLEWYSNPMFYQKQVTNDFPDFNSHNDKMRKHIVTSTSYKIFTHTSKRRRVQIIPQNSVNTELLNVIYEKHIVQLNFCSD